jgi:hypothetical protein
MSISEDEAKSIFLDRIKFKFHCAEKHLNNLKDFEREGEFFNQSWNIRIKWQDEVECVLYHLIGVTDALLSRINDKFNFGLHPHQINIKKISQLLGKDRGYLLSELHESEEGINWLYCLRKLRNIGTHRSFLNVKVSRTIGDNGGQITSLRIAPDIPVVIYLEESTRKMKELINSVFEYEFKLKEP